MNENYNGIVSDPIRDQKEKETACGETKTAVKQVLKDEYPLLFERNGRRDMP